MEETARRSGTQSVGRVSVILREVAVHNHRGMSSTEVAAHAGLSYPTAHRLLHRLVAEGLLDRDPRTKCYVLGPLTYELGLTARQHVDLRAVWRPALRAIAATTGESAFLISRSFHDSVCIDRVDGRYACGTMTLQAGSRRPLGVGAGGIAILALLPADEAAAILARNARRFRMHEHVDIPALRHAVKRCRDLGYASRDGPVSGARAVAIAVRSSRDPRQIVALSVSGTLHRFGGRRQQELASRLRAAAASMAW
jgi:DNA-binding IclR family transcriptional regulator